MSSIRAHVSSIRAHVSMSRERTCARGPGWAEACAAQRRGSALRQVEEQGQEGVCDEGRRGEAALTFEDGRAGCDGRGCDRKTSGDFWRMCEDRGC
eukprot:406158-Rhodomonas_salina.2